MRLPKLLMVIPIIAVASLALVAQPALGAGVQTNPLCWPDDACRKAGGYPDDKDLTCGTDKWFPCIADKPIDIAVHIPGNESKTTQVRDIADYIARIYRYAIPVAAILAVIAIMVGGLLYLTSAGAERLSAAKKWIGNAIIGLLLALLSYTILQTINPDLVRLSLPRVRMIRQITLGGKFCTEVVRNDEKNGRVAQFAEREDGQYALTFDKTASENATGPFRCGNPLYPAGTSTKTCIGTVCGRNTVCVPKGDTFGCESGMFGGRITYHKKAYADRMWLMAYCKNRDSETISSINLNEVSDAEGVQGFALPQASASTQLSVCDSNPNNIAGLYLKVEVNDTDRKFWGSLGMTLDDEFIIFKSGCSGSGSVDPVNPDHLQAVLGSAQAGDPRLWQPEDFFSIQGRSQPPGSHQPCELDIDPSNFKPR